MGVNKIYRAKGQTKSKWFFPSQHFFQETNKRIQLYWYLRSTCFRPFFGRNRRLQKDIWKLTFKRTNEPMHLPVTLFWVVGRFSLVEIVQNQSQNLPTFHKNVLFFSLHFIKISIGGDDQSIFLESGSLWCTICLYSCSDKKR